MIPPLAQSDDPRRQFAVETVRTLRTEGFEALWAGGCVRDQLLGKTPQDYDVASTATPDDVIRIFGKRRTVAVGASFGVVMVLGPQKSSGQIEVATFRSEGEYLDGRRPSSVRFCRPEEDAHRRDFTINGMFIDPLDGRLIDYVGGREDLALGVVRAIGDPVARFTEDKLRMLRAVRFAATLNFELDSATAEAARQLRQQLNQVSAERIAQELRRMLASPSRDTAFRLLLETGLLPEVLPELFSTDLSSAELSDQTSGLRRELAELHSDRFEPAFALILRSLYASDQRGKPTLKIESVCRRLKLANEETECVCWLIQSLPVLNVIAAQPLHVRKPLLNHPHRDLLLQISTATDLAAGRPATVAEFCRNYLAELRGDDLCPPPLIDGQDLFALQVPQGPAFRDLLTTIRSEQLDEQLTTREAALERLRELVEMR